MNNREMKMEGVEVCRLAWHGVDGAVVSGCALGNLGALGIPGTQAWTSHWLGLVIA